MDNMKARCWYEHTMPIIHLASNKKDDFAGVISKLIAASSDVAKILRDHVKAAWFSRPKDVKGDTFFISGSFWEDTGIQILFLGRATSRRNRIRKNLQHLFFPNGGIQSFLPPKKIFDRFALNATDEPRNMKRIALAANRFPQF